MKKIIYTLTVSLLVSLMSISCQKEDNITPTCPLYLPQPPIGTGKIILQDEELEVRYVHVNRFGSSETYDFYAMEPRKFLTVTMNDGEATIFTYTDLDHPTIFNNYIGDIEIARDGENYHIKGTTDYNDIKIVYDGRVYDASLPKDNGLVVRNGDTCKVNSLIVDKSDNNLTLALDNRDLPTLVMIYYNHGMLKAGEYTVTADGEGSNELVMVAEQFNGEIIDGFPTLTGTAKIRIDGETVIISATVSDGTDEYTISYNGPIIWCHWDMF